MKDVVNPSISVPVTVNSLVASVVPSPVSVPTYGVIGNFTIMTQPVAVDTPVVVTVTYDGQQLTEDFTIVPPTVYSTSVSTGGITKGQTVTLTVTMNYPAPAGGYSVPVTNNDPSILIGPSSVTIPGGSTVGTAVYSDGYTGNGLGDNVVLTAGGIGQTVWVH
jgi:hypothetical protein